jgi:hypothetical protein
VKLLVLQGKRIDFGPKPPCSKIWIDQAGRKKMYFTLGRRMNILIMRLFDPLAEQLDEN